MTKKSIIKFVILFIITLVIVTSYFTYVLTGAFEVAFQPIHLLKIMKQFGVVISLPTALLLMGIDYLFCKMIANKILLQLLRIIAFFIIIYLVSLAFSSYLIINSMLNNPILSP